MLLGKHYRDALDEGGRKMHSTMNSHMDKPNDLEANYKVEFLPKDKLLWVLVEEDKGEERQTYLKSFNAPNGVWHRVTIEIERRSD